MIVAAADPRHFNHRFGQMIRVPALCSREGFSLLIWLGLCLVAAEPLSEFLASSRPVELEAFGPIALISLIILAGYRSIPPHTPCFISGGCTVATAARHRAFFHRYPARTCKGGWGNDGNGRAVLATSPPNDFQWAAGRGRLALYLEVPDRSASCHVPVAYRFVRVAKSRGSPSILRPLLLRRGIAVLKKYSPSPIA